MCRKSRPAFNTGTLLHSLHPSDVEAAYSPGRFRCPRTFRIALIAAAQAPEGVLLNMRHSLIQSSSSSPSSGEFFLSKGEFLSFVPPFKIVLQCRIFSYSESFPYRGSDELDPPARQGPLARTNRTGVPKGNFGSQCLLQKREGLGSEDE